MKDEKETQQRVEQRLREAAPPMPQDTQSVWPAVQERLQPRQRASLRPLLWAGAAAVCASLYAAGWMLREPQIAPLPSVLPRVAIQVTTVAPAPVTNRVHHVPHAHKVVIAVRTIHPHPSHIAYRKLAEPPIPEQTPLPDKEADTPRLRPAAAVPRPVLVKPVE